MKKEGAGLPKEEVYQPVEEEKMAAERAAVRETALPWLKEEKMRAIPPSAETGLGTYPPWAPTAKKEEKKPPAEAPIIFEFPRLSEELKIAGILPFETAEEVKHLPIVAHKIPRERLGTIIPSEWVPPALTGIDARYTLIEPYAYANIRWDEEAQELRYNIIEPPLTEEEKDKLDRLKTLIIDLLDINLMDIRDMNKVKDYLYEKVNQVVADYEIQMTEVEYNKILYYIYRDFLGLERLEPIIQDLQVEDISCDGVEVPIFVFHRKYGSIKTNIQFTDPEMLNNFIVKVAQRCGKHISVADPLMDGALPDGSRVSATYSAGKDIAMRGSTFSIRKFTKDPLTIIDLISFGTLPPLIASYLWLAVEFKKSVLVSGGTATGKTSLLNSLSLFIPAEAKIVSIEDTPEINLPHEHWIAKIARAGYGPEDEGGRRRGEISMFDLLRTALRERPDYLIVGEVRGKEAYVLFQGMATGHAGLATIHAESIEAVVSRLQTPPISLSPGLLQHLNIVVIAAHAKVKGVEVRRIKEIVEIVAVDAATGRPITNQLFRWVPAGDYFEFASDRSYILNKIIEEKGIPEESMWEEVRRREKILAWMKDNNVRYFMDVGRLIAAYYRNPEEVLTKVGIGK